MLTFLQLLIPASLWGLAAFIAANQFLGLNDLASFFGALGVAAVIFVVDRTMLNMTFCSDEELARGLESEPWYTSMKKSWLALGRGLMLTIRFALVVIGALINAFFLDVQLFENDFQSQLFNILIESAEANEITPQLSDLDKQIERLAAEEHELGGKAELEAQALFAEIDGIRGTGRHGYGISAHKKESKFNETNVRLTAVSDLLAALRSERYAAAHSLRTQALAREPGILLKVEALHRLMEQNQVAKNLSTGFLLFLLLIEVLVILYKAGTPYTPYERFMAFKAYQQQQAVTVQAGIQHLRGQRLLAMSDAEHRARAFLAHGSNGR